MIDYNNNILYKINVPEDWVNATANGTNTTGALLGYTDFCREFNYTGNQIEECDEDSFVYDADECTRIENEEVAWPGPKCFTT